MRDNFCKEDNQALTFKEASPLNLLSLDRNLYHFGYSMQQNSLYRRFNAIVSQLKMHYFSEGAFESLIASQLLKKEKYI